MHQTAQLRSRVEKLLPALKERPNVISTGLSKSEAKKQPLNLFVKKADILYEGEKIGTATLTFTDSFARAEVAEITFQLSVLGALLLIIIFIVMLLVTGKIITALKDLSNSLKGLAEGEGDLTTRISESSQDEVGDVARFFNKFIDKLKDIIIVVKDSTKDLVDQKTNLIANTEETASAATQITMNVNSIKGQIESLDHETESVSSALKKIESTANSLNESTGNQAAAVEETMASVTQMIAQLKNVATVVDGKKEGSRGFVRNDR